MRTYIFDLDGTLANIQHRLHFIRTSETNPSKDWDGFFAACTDDEPIQPTIALLNILKQNNHWIIITSGRSDIVRAETVKWLQCHNVKYDYLVMRRHNDHRPDDVVKQEWLTDGVLGPRKEIAGVFDDRKRVVDMWRRNGLLCYHVADGDF